MAGGMTKTRAERVLGLGNYYTLRDVKVARRKQAKGRHPDVGGNAEAMYEVNAACDYLEGLFSKEKKAVMSSEERSRETSGHTESASGSWSSSAVDGGSAGRRSADSYRGQGGQSDSFGGAEPRERVNHKTPSCGYCESKSETYYVPDWMPTDRPMNKAEQRIYETEAYAWTHRHERYQCSSGETAKHAAEEYVKREEARRPDMDSVRKPLWWRAFDVFDRHFPYDGALMLVAVANFLVVFFGGGFLPLRTMFPFLPVMHAGNSEEVALAMFGALGLLAAAFLNVLTETLSGSFRKSLRWGFDEALILTRRKTKEAPPASSGACWSADDENPLWFRIAAKIALHFPYRITFLYLAWCLWSGVMEDVGLLSFLGSSIVLLVAVANMFVPFVTDRLQNTIVRILRIAGDKSYYGV